MDQSFILLETKLQRPRVTSDLVYRPRLIEKLNAGLARPLILVCAGAGFGKTTLVSSWLASREAGDSVLPAAWLSLDERDDELSVFLQYFVAAVRTIFPGGCSETLQLLQATKDPPLRVLIATVINELAALPGEFVLVLDDHHHVHSEAINELFIELTRHWPQPMHLVLISRYNPSLPLTRLRAQGLVTEILSEDLRFTLDETTDFLRRVAPALPPEKDIKSLVERTEGWIAGLQLAALFGETAQHATSGLAEMPGPGIHFSDYLTDEVVSGQPEAIQAFLIKTSVLNHFCAPLGDAIGAGDGEEWNGRACIDFLQRAHLFIVPLGDGRSWYRYHHLFRDVLQQRLHDRLEPAEVQEIHRRAAAWLATNNLIDEALQHAIAAGDLELAAGLMERGLVDVLNREDRATLERWLRLLPAELIRTRPWLMAIKGWVLELTWLLPAQWALLDELEALLAAQSESLPAESLRLLRGNVALCRGQEAYIKGQPERAIDLLQEALTLLPNSWWYARSGCMQLLCMALHAEGEGSAAERMLLEDYQALEDKTTHYALRILRGLEMHHHLAGHEAQVRQLGQTVLQMAQARMLPYEQAWAHFVLGHAYYAWNDLEAAAPHFAAIVDKHHTAGMEIVPDATACLALIQQLLGQRAEAWETADFKSRLDIAEQGSESAETLALRAELALLEGDLTRAASWAEGFEAPVMWPLPWAQPPHMTKARVLLVRGGQADLAAAVEILDQLLAIATHAHITRYAIEVEAMRVLALDGLGQTRASEEALRAAVALSQPGGYLRAFIALGPRMAALLSRLAARRDAEDNVAATAGYILAAFRASAPLAESPATSSGATLPLTAGQPAGANAGVLPLVEPLSRREIEILTLLREPLTAKEIAAQLHISPNTAERHVANIYAKLGVGRRREALARSEALGILPPR